MRLDVPGREVHLTYCLNVHPTETADDLAAALEGPVVAVRDRILPGGRFGVGLRLAAGGVRELIGDRERRLDFQRKFDRLDLYPFTMNAFPYGNFHAERVKENVFKPTWLDADRITYTACCAQLLAEWMPDDVTCGSVSTSPGSYKPWGNDAGTRRRMAENLLSAARQLARIEKKHNRRLRLCIEPEPFGTVETTEEAADFFAEHLRELDWGLTDHHLGVCFDTCHQAVEGENLPAAIRTLSDRGIAIGKVQISAGIEAHAPGSEETRARLAAFDEPRYFHQTLSDGEPRLYAADLSEALDDPVWRERDCWRVHFHVPLDRDEVGGLPTTRETIPGALAAALSLDPVPHLEVETYTWGVLPEETPDDLTEGIAREIAWARDAALATTTRG